MDTPLTIDDLRAACASGWRPRFLFFWGHTSRGGRIDAACLSQWYPAPFEVDGVRYPTAEHWMMAEKARLFGDTDALDRILEAGSPGKAKALGRAVRGFDHAVWSVHRERIVTDGSTHKFEQNPPLREFLRTTGQRVLVEASPHDRIWGIGLAKDDPRAADPQQWRGLNLLGFALMRARAALA